MKFFEEVGLKTINIRWQSEFFLCICAVCEVLCYDSLDVITTIVYHFNVAFVK